MDGWMGGWDGKKTSLIFFLSGKEGRKEGLIILCSLCSSYSVLLILMFSALCLFPSVCAHHPLGPIGSCGMSCHALHGSHMFLSLGIVSSVACLLGIAYYCGK